MEGQGQEPGPVICLDGLVLGAEPGAKPLPEYDKDKPPASEEQEQEEEDDVVDGQTADHIGYARALVLAVIGKKGEVDPVKTGGNVLDASQGGLTICRPLVAPRVVDRAAFSEMGTYLVLLGRKRGYKWLEMHSRFRLAV